MKAQSRSTEHDLKRTVRAGWGFLTILEAPKNIKERYEPWGYQGNTLNLMKSLKTKFDPYNLFNSGLFIGGI